jgi:hypothetical protein
MDQERRGSIRHRTLKEAKVVLHDSSTIDCIIRNISEGGAHLDFTDPVALPDQFEVLIVATSALVPAERIWERGRNQVHRPGKARATEPVLNPRVETRRRAVLGQAIPSARTACSTVPTTTFIHAPWLALMSHTMNRRNSGKIRRPRMGVLPAVCSF